MIDWNNDGKIDGEDWMITDIILDEEEQDGKDGSSKNTGSCLASVLLFLVLPVACILTVFGRL